MEILKRAKGRSDGEVVSAFESEASVKEEVDRRTAKAGYTTKLGEPTYGSKILSTCNWGQQRLNIWPRDKDGHLIGD